MQRLTQLILIALGLFLLTACFDGQTGTDAPETTTLDSAEQAAAETSTPDQTHGDEASDMSDSLPTPLTLEQATEAARSDMSTRMAIAAEDIQVITARTVTWGDGSLGCPEPGMMYTQALVPGLFIHLRHGSKDAFYHAGRSGQPRFCPADRSSAPSQPDRRHPGSHGRSKD